MKKVFLLAGLLLAFSAKYASSQSSTKDIIILANGDTLSIPQISKNRKLTNQDEIVYFDGQNQKHKLKASELKAYYVKDESFYSEMIKDENTSRLVSYEVGGYVFFGLSYTSAGDMNFYVKKDNEVIDLGNYRGDLKKFFRTYLVDFDKFYAGHPVKIDYDFKALAEMLSAYNAFKNPELNVAEKFKNKEQTTASIFISAGMMNSTFSGYYKNKFQGSSFSVGMDLQSKYSRIFTIHFPLSYNMSSTQAPETSIHWSTINLEPYLTVKTFSQKKLSFEIGAGIGMLYSLNSYLDGSLLIESDQDKVSINKMSIGPNVSVIAHLDRKLKAQLMYVRYQTATRSMKESSLENSSAKILANNLRLMVSYDF